MKIIDARRIKPRDLLIQFARLTADENNAANFIFVTELGDGNAYVRRMRVELSRIKKKIEARGKVIKPFKMLIVKIATINMAGSEAKLTKVHLRKIVNLDEDIVVEMDMLLTGLAVGDKIDE